MLTRQTFFHKQKLRNQKHGQTLMEVVVAVGIVTLVLTVLLSAITVSLANINLAKNKVQATKYAQEATEWLRSQRDELGWDTFYNKATNGSRTYCLNSISIWPSSGACPNGTYITGTNYAREALLDGIGGPNQDRVTVTMAVSWFQNKRNQKVSLVTYLSEW